MTDAHEGEIQIGAIANVEAPPTVGVPKLQFVRYPGAQQLVLWLPQHGYFGYRALRVTGPHGAIEDTNVRDRLNGSVQILWDTLTWPPGAYGIEITHDEGWRHAITLEKFAEGAAPAPPPAPPPPTPASDAPIVYRDGFGNILPNTDLELRAKLTAELAQKLTNPRLEFEGNFRAGTITYIDGDRRIAFWHEMAGGKYKFYIDIPPPDAWEARTGVPLAERDAILRFVAEETHRQQGPNWRYEINDREILFA